MVDQAVSHVRRGGLTNAFALIATTPLRLWMLGPPLLLAVLGAFIAVHLEATAWRGKAEVSLAVPQVFSTALTLTFGEPDLRTPYVQGQAKRARSPRLALRVVRAAGIPGLTAERFLQHSSARPVPDADLLTLSASYRPHAAAVRLTNAYANEFVRFKHDLDTQRIQETLRRFQARIQKLRARGRTTTPAYEALVQGQTQLRAIALQFRNTTSVFKSADGASSFRPHAFRNGLVGGALGALLGFALALGVAARRQAKRR